MHVWHMKTYLLLVNVCRYTDVYEYVRTGINCKQLGYYHSLMSKIYIPCPS